MSKRNKILLSILFLLVIVTALYYYFFCFSSGQTSSAEVLERIEQVDNPGIENKIIEESSGDLDEETGELEKIDIAEGIEKDQSESVEDILEKSPRAYAYRRVFRNPFQEYRVMEKRSDEISLSQEEVKGILPFQLKGVIGSQQERLAVIVYNKESKIIEVGTEIEDCLITDIVDNGINIIYRGIVLKIEMRSDLIENR